MSGRLFLLHAAEGGSGHYCDRGDYTNNQEPQDSHSRDQSRTAPTTVPRGNAAILTPPSPILSSQKSWPPVTDLPPVPCENSHRIGAARRVSFSQDGPGSCPKTIFGRIFELTH